MCYDRCCRAEHAFRIHGGNGIVGQTNPTLKNFCASPITDPSYYGTNECPAHFTSYHHTSTGCQAYCAAAFQREGIDETCMPGKPECANWLDAQSFPDRAVTVNAWCICGAKRADLVTAGQYVNVGTILARTRRSLQASPRRWPQSATPSISQHHGKTSILSLEHTHILTYSHTHPNTHT